VAAGGSTGQVLQKLSSTSYDTGWLTLPADYINSVSAPLAVASGVLSVDLSSYLPLAGGYMTGAIFNTDAIGGLYLNNFSLGANWYTNVTWSGIQLSGGSGSSAKTMTIQGDGITFWHGGISKQTVAYPGAEILFDNAALTGNPSAPTPATSDNSTRIATTAFVKAQGYLTSAPVTSVAGKTGVVTLDNTDISGLGTLAVVNDAPSDGSQYARKNAAWDVVIPGDRYLTTSTTSNTVSNGNKTFTIGTGLSYTPTQNITISYNASNHMHGEVLTYNSGTGVLTVDVNHHTGSGTYASWVVNVGGVTPATSVDFSDITGAVSGNTNLQAALDLKANAADYLSKAGNLSGLANTATARTNLLLGATNTVAFRAVNLSEGAPDIGDTLSTLNVVTSSGNYGVGGSTASYVDDGSGSPIVSESASFGLDKNNFSLALYPTYDTSNPSSPTSGLELNYVTATGVLSLRAYDNPGSTDYVTTLSPFGLILPASGGSITFGDATVQTTAAFNPDLSPYAPLASPTFSGSPSLPTGSIGVTQSPGNNTTALATTAFVTAAVPAFGATADVNSPSSTTKAASIANVREMMLSPGYQLLYLAVGQSGTALSGYYNSNGGRFKDYASSTVSGSYGQWTFDTAGSSIGYAGYTRGANLNVHDWSKKIWIVGRCLYGVWSSSAGIGDANTFARINLGGKNGLSSGDLIASFKGVGWKFAGGGTSPLVLTVANASGTLVNVTSSFTPVAKQAFDWAIYSDGTGNVTLYVNDAQVATTALGPTGTTNNGLYIEGCDATATATSYISISTFGTKIYHST
jgi:hypothetical protein